MEHFSPSADAATTPFVRIGADIDDTIPVDLYSRPYERLELVPRAPPRRPEPQRVPPALFGLALGLAFGLGFALVVLLAS